MFIFANFQKWLILTHFSNSNSNKIRNKIFMAIIFSVFTSVYPSFYVKKRIRAKNSIFTPKNCVLSHIGIFSNLSTFEIRTSIVRIWVDRFFRILFQKLRLAPKLFQYQNGPKRLSCADHAQDPPKSPKNRVYPLNGTDSWDVLPGIRPNGLHSSQNIPQESFFTVKF